MILNILATKLSLIINNTILELILNFRNSFLINSNFIYINVIINLILV